MTFKIIDKKTGKEPTDRVITNIAKKQGLIAIRIDQFAITEDGQIILLDDCGRVAYLDMNRFEVRWDGWIPCSERLPKAGEYIGDVAKYYLVQNEYGDMLVARYTYSEYWEQIYELRSVGDDVIAWQELPEPYREDGDTE